MVQRFMAACVLQVITAPLVPYEQQITHVQMEHTILLLEESLFQPAFHVMVVKCAMDRVYLSQMISVLLDSIVYLVQEAPHLLTV